MEYKYIKVVIAAGRMNLTLARPEKRNAFTPTMVNEIAHALEFAHNENDVRVVVLRAEGPVFCAGMDLKVFENPDLDDRNPAIENRNISLGEVFDNFHKPIFAIVKGNVIAGAFLMICGCTYVYCDRSVQFKLPELALGIFPFQVLASLLKILPEKKVLQLCLETDYFDAQKAKDLSIVDGFLEDTDVEAKIQSLVTSNPIALMAGIQALRKLSAVPRDKQYEYLKTVLDTLR